MNMTRRQFMKRSAGLMALAGASYYSYKAGLSGIVEGIRYCANSILPLKKPQDKFLYDQHFHLGKFRGRNLRKVVDTFFEKADIVNITLHGPKLSPRDCSYEDFVQSIKDNRLAEVKFSDECATILYNGSKDLVLFKAQEYMTYNPYVKSHKVHANISGHGYIEDLIPADRAIERVLNAGGIATLNHPFSIPVRYVKFWFPDEKETLFLEKLVKDYDIFIEEHNMMNALWMAASNAKARNLRLASKRKGLAGTDAHASRLSYTKQMIGHAGTLLDSMPDFRSLSGREMAQSLAKHIKGNKIGILNNYANPWLFFNVMALGR